MILLSASIDRNSHMPYYIQVRDILLDHISQGTLKPGDQLPGEPELCTMFDVSRPVIRQALKELEYKGIVVRKKGKGTFVAEPKIHESLVQKLTGFHHDMVNRGYTPITKILKNEVTAADAKIAGRLGLGVGDQVIVIERLRSIDDEPITLTVTYLPYALCPSVATADLENRSLYQYLEDECGLTIANGRRTLEAVLANDYEASLLQIKKGAPLVLLNSISYLEDGTPLEYYHAVHRGDRSKFEVELVKIREQAGVRQVLGEQRVTLPPSDHLSIP